MKKNYFFTGLFTMVLAGMTFSACSDDDTASPNPEQEPTAKGTYVIAASFTKPLP